MSERHTTGDYGRRFAVVGDPVGHSKSPAIHTAAFAACGIDATYEAIRVRAGQFGMVADELRSGKLNGVNVTMPLKDEAFRSIDRSSPDAARAESVNTVTPADGLLTGRNTDVAGVMRAVDKLEVDDEAPVLILGGGGAARSAAIAVEGRTITVSTRRPMAAASLLEVSATIGTVAPWGAAIDGAIVINATPLGMHGESLPDEVLLSSAGLVDMAYGSQPTAAVTTARHLGIPVADGLDMLVGQAAAAFTVFTGMAAPLDVMETAARKAN